MKKALSIIIVLALMVSLVACGSTNTDVQKPSDVSTTNTSSENKQTGKQEVTIAETVLVDEAGVKITAKGLDYESFLGVKVKLLIENNSGKDLTFQCRDSSVNGYMVDTLMSVDVVNGKKANDSLTLSDSDLELCGINEIADIELSFHIFESDGWDTYLDTNKVQIKTSIADTYNYSFDDSGDLAYQGNNVKVVVKGLAEDDSILGPSVVVYIENSSDKDITVQTRDVSINGFMVSAIFSSEVTVGKHAVDTIAFLSSDLEENEITKIEDVELSFHIFESDGWDTIVDTDVVKITF
jgi:hypothetical protein